MSKKKLLRYEQFSQMPHCFECPAFINPQLTNNLGEVVELKGKWNEYFGNPNPITLELGCGRGEYTVSLAQRYPNRNFIGVDIKGNRMHVGALSALEQELDNVAFLRMPIECIEHFFAAHEVAEIWITFADPQPFKPRKRLTSPLFLARYRKVIAPDTVFHLKTDSDILYQSTIEVLEQEKGTILYQNNDIYATPLLFDELNCKTNYEKIHLALGKTIKYLRFQL